eukprot:5007539-Karenia_brevis.AAC.1
MVLARQVLCRDDDGWPSFNVDGLHLSSDESDEEIEAPTPAPAPASHRYSLSAQVDDLIDEIMKDKPAGQHAAAPRLPPAPLQTTLKGRQTRAPRKRKATDTSKPEAKRGQDLSKPASEAKAPQEPASQPEDLQTSFTPASQAEATAEPIAEGKPAVMSPTKHAPTDEDLLRECMKNSALPAGALLYILHHQSPMHRSKLKFTRNFGILKHSINHHPAEDPGSHSKSAKPRHQASPTSMLQTEIYPKFRTNVKWSLAWHSHLKQRSHFFPRLKAGAPPAP